MCLKDTARDVQSNLLPCSEKLLQEDFEQTCCGGMNYNSIHFISFICFYPLLAKTMVK